MDVLSEKEKEQFEKWLLPLLSQMIQNRCINDGTLASGNEIKNAMLLADFFAESNIPAIIDSPKEPDAQHRASLFSFIEGSEKGAETYALMGHLDVVPSNPKLWSFPPHEGKYDGEFLYGRGAVDMQGQVAVMASAYRSVIEEMGQPKKSIKFFGVADEEADGILGAARLIKEHPDWAACDYLISELGGYFIDDSHVAIAVSEKGLVRLRLECDGTSAHGSMPYRADNAILKLNRCIALLETAYPHSILTPPAVAMIEAMPFNDPSLKERLLNQESLAGALDQIYQESPGLAKLIHSALHLTISVGVFQGGTKVNIIPDYASAQLDIRLPLGENKESFCLRLKEIFPDDVRMQSLEEFEPNSSPLDTPFYRALEQTAKEIYPEIALVPVIPAGVTDCRYWRLWTQVKAAYGFSLFSKDYTYEFFAKGLHGRDEKISIPSLQIAFHFFRNLLKRVLY